MTGEYGQFIFISKSGDADLGYITYQAYNGPVTITAPQVKQRR